MAWDASDNMYSNSCDDFIRYYVGTVGDGGTCMIVESSTKHYPTILDVSPDIHHLKDAPWNSSLRKFSIGVISISQLVRNAPFIFPNPCGGVLGGMVRLSLL